MNGEVPTSLNQTGVEALQASGVSVREFGLYRWPNGIWHGDTCGCPDGRCTGYHEHRVL